MLETRKARRYRCEETMDCEAWGGVQVVLMKDLSMLGARLRGEELPEVGNVVRVTPSFAPRRAWIFAQVCWRRDLGEDGHEAGIRFMEPLTRLQSSWVGHLVSGKNSAERRRSIRVPSELYVEMKVSGRKLIEATSVDLSRGGALVEGLPAQVRRGEQADLQLCLPWCVVEVPAKVVRNDGSRPASLRFLDLSEGDGDALECYLKEEISRREALQTPSLGLSFLKLLNQRPQRQ